MSCPDHYKLTTLFRKDGSPAEVIDICDELAPEDPNQFQAIEYLLRCKKKGQLESDLEKCKFYIDRMLSKLQNPLSDLGERLSCADCKHRYVMFLSPPCSTCMVIPSGGTETKGTNWEPRT